MSCASGVIYAVRALEILRSLDIETHLIVTRAAELTRAYETARTREELNSMANFVYNISDVGAPKSPGYGARTPAERTAGGVSSLACKPPEAVGCP